MNEYEKQRLARQMQNERRIRELQKQAEAKEGSLGDTLGTANKIREGVGDIGNAMSTSKNANIAKAGSNLYKFSGQQGLDALKGNPTGVGSSIVDTTTGANTATSGLSNAGQTASNVTSGANTASTVADGASKASTITNGAGKVAGAVGGAMNAVDSATKFAKGDAVGGGLSALKLASLAGGPIGWGVYALATIAEMFKGAQDKKRQKTLSQTQEADAEAMQNQKEHQFETMQKVAERKAEAVNDIGEHNVGSNMSSTLDNMGENQIDTNTLDTEETLVNEPANGVITGGASPIEGQATENSFIDRIAEQEDWMRKNNYTEEKIKGLRQGLNYGDKETAEWIDQYNNGSGRENPIAIPKTEEEIAKAKAGQFNPVPQQASVDEKETFKDLLMKELGGALGDFSEGFKENRSTSFAPENIMADKMADGRDKNFLNRAGEAFGTANRLLTNPLLQGGLAGLAYGIDKGDALYGLGKGVEWAGNKAKSNMYAKELGQQPTVLGNITADDYKAVTTNAYRHQKLIQDNYMKEMKMLDEAHKNGRISDAEYVKQVNETNKAYDGAIKLSQPLDVQNSNQTRMANVAEGNLKERGRHNKVTEGISQQNANTNAKYKQLNHELAQDKLNFQKTKYSQKQIDEKINNGELIKVSHKGKTLIIPREQLKNAIKDGAKVVR